MKVRTRYAPSPTGRMHVGNLRTALYAYLIAKHEGGDFLLRIEDTDQERYVEGAVDIIYRTLEETGLVHDEGPDKDGGYGPYVQSERMKTGIYMKYAKELIEKGQQVTMDGILHDINERDRQDMTRTVAPLKQADDAVLLDTSSLTLEESIAAVLRIIREKTEEKA